MLRDAMHKRWNKKRKTKIIQRRFYHADDCFWKGFRQNIAMTWFCAVYMSWTGSKQQHNNNTHTFKLQKKSVETSTLLFIFTHDPNVQLSREDRYEIHFVWRSFESTNNSRMIGILFMTNMCSEGNHFFKHLGRGAVLFFHYVFAFSSLLYFFQTKLLLFSFDNCHFEKPKVQLFCQFQVFCDKCKRRRLWASLPINSLINQMEYNHWLVCEHINVSVIQLMNSYLFGQFDIANRHDQSNSLLSWAIQFLTTSFVTQLPRSSEHSYDKL